MAFDAATSTLYITTSHTKVNNYRDCPATDFDPLVDPPSNDYDPRRGTVVQMTLGANLRPAAKGYIDGLDGAWTTPVVAPASRRDIDSFSVGSSVLSPVDYDPNNGLIATLRAALAGNVALGLTDRNAGVLIAISTIPKFGEPVNGTTYLPGQALPYNNTNGFGGPAAAASAGYVLAVPGAPGSAAFPYWNLNNLAAAGQLIGGYQTTAGGAVVNLNLNTTYYFKAWAYDAARNYSRGMEASAPTNDIVPLKANEFNSNVGQANGWIEIFNPSGQAVDVSNYFIMDDTARPTQIANPTVIPARSYLNYPLGNGWKLGAGSDNIRIFRPDGSQVEEYSIYTRNQLAGNTSGRVWDGGPRGMDFDYRRFSNNVLAPRFENVSALHRNAGAATHPITQTAPNNVQSAVAGRASAKFFQASQNTRAMIAPPAPALTPVGINLHYANLGQQPAVWAYSPKQQDFHSINVEGLAVRSQAEIVVGLRSPLTGRTSGNAYAFVFDNSSNGMLPAGGWSGPAGGAPVRKELNLNGQGIRSIQWCANIRNGADPATGPVTGAYLIIGGPANGGPLKNETTRGRFSLYQWDNVNALPVRLVADLSPYAVRPEGINIIAMLADADGNPATPDVLVRRAIFVEDRFRARGYDTQNAVHWPLSTLNIQ